MTRAVDHLEALRIAALKGDRAAVRELLAAICNAEPDEDTHDLVDRSIGDSLALLDMHRPQRSALREAGEALSVVAGVVVFGVACFQWFARMSW